MRIYRLPKLLGFGRSPEFLPGVFVVSIDGASYGLSIVRNKARGRGGTRSRVSVFKS
jgi:hypothetical protein